ncbi:MAG: hypothetical protein ACLQO6_02830 [Desulfomonilaceae bacterium]
MSKDFVTHTELDKFRAEVHAWLVDMLAEVSKLKPPPEPTDIPPIAPRQPRGKALQGKKFDLRVRVDKNLANLLIKTAKKDYGGNISRALDVVLWRYFDRPKLTFEDKNDTK